jgi:hypothetical protein
MFYAVAIAGVLSAQNMLSGAFRGTKIGDDTPTRAAAPRRHIVTGATTVRDLLSAGVGLDTEISMEGGSGSSGHISLADLSSPEADEEGEDDSADSEEESVSGAVEEPSGGFSKMLKAELVSVAESAGLDSSGTKADIIARLNAA